VGHVSGHLAAGCGERCSLPLPIYLCPSLGNRCKPLCVSPPWPAAFHFSTKAHNKAPGEGEGGGSLVLKIITSVWGFGRV
jgi:hypothetical protein